MCHVEMDPLAISQWCDLCTSLAHIDKMGFAGSVRLPHRFKDLLIAAFDPHNWHACYLGHGSRELAETSAEINNALSGSESGLCKKPLVEEVVHRGQPLLFRWTGSVGVVRRGHAVLPGMVW
jgi:hypothetical protein